MTLSRSVPLVATWFALALLACGAEATTPTDDTCEVLFGRPNARTGLDASRCRPSCTCGDRHFEAPTYDASFLAALTDDWVLAKPLARIDTDPYVEPPAEEDDDTVCAVLPGPATAAGPRSYELVDFPSEATARAAGAHPTHFGRCGVCSTLANLAVYVREDDLTEPVRACGLSSKERTAHVACLEALGFEGPCADIWYWNTLHTKAVCLAPCLAALGQPYHAEDGSLNDCLACDERESGPVFKTVAGRTRRNSGLPNAMCRPCDEVRPLVHAYPRTR
ncbi:MAG: hypothetical protein FJ096_01890 [Deltaproteobacteria bacterium]|nr:hypothetical protein [Deltaproteobacteria bacterium]